MLIRTIELADEPDDTTTSVVASYLSSSSSLGTDGEVEYLYRREPELYYSSFEVSGYETDQSASSEASDTEARASSPGTPDLNHLAREDPCEPAMMYNPWAAVLSQARAHSPSWAHVPAVEEAEGTSRVFVTPRADSPYRRGIAGRPTSSSSSHSDGFPEHSVISRKSAVAPRSAVSGHGVHTFSRNWDGTPSSPQPWSYARYEANRRLNQARNTRPGNEMGSLLRQGTGSSLSNSPPGPSWQAWGSLPSAAERGLPGASSPVLPPVRTPLSNLSVNRRSWRKSWVSIKVTIKGRSCWNGQPPPVPPSPHLIGSLSKPGRRRQREEPGKDCFRNSAYSYLGSNFFRFCQSSIASSSLTMEE